MSYLLTSPADRAAYGKTKHGTVNPANPDGGSFYYCVVMPDGEDYLYADSLTDVLAYLIPSYLELDEEDKAVERIRLAGSIATTMQAVILSALPQETVSSEEWAILIAPKLGPKVARADWWGSPIPLIVVETSYVPYTSSSRPASATSEGHKADNLWWVRPTDDDNLVISLHEIGYLHILENIDMETEEY